MSDAITYDPDVRASISGFAQADRDWVRSRVDRLRADLGRGAWHERYGRLLDRETIDLGYRFVRVAPRPGRG